MYAGVLIDELVKQVEHVELKLVLQMFSAEAGRPTAAVSVVADTNSHSNHFNGPLAGSGTAEAVRPHAKV